MSNVYSRFRLGAESIKRCQLMCLIPDLDCWLFSLQSGHTRDWMSKWLPRRNRKSEYWHLISKLLIKSSYKKEKRKVNLILFYSLWNFLKTMLVYFLLHPDSIEFKRDDFELIYLVAVCNEGSGKSFCITVWVEKKLAIATAPPNTCVHIVNRVVGFGSRLNRVSKKYWFE